MPKKRYPFLDDYIQGKVIPALEEVHQGSKKSDFQEKFKRGELNQLNNIMAENSQFFVSSY
jgi:hypothetical protein